MCTYLDKVGSTYYFRRAVPEDLRSFIRTATGKPRTEFKVSLRTKVREDAKRRLLDAMQVCEQAFDEARAKLASGSDAMAEPAGNATMDASMAKSIRASEHLAAAQSERQRKREPLRQGILDRINSYSTAELPPYEAAIKDILRERRQIAHVEPAKQEVAPVPLLELFDSYATEAGIKPSTMREWRAVIDKLIVFLGHDDATRITEVDLRTWRNLLLNAPPERRGVLRDPRTVRGTYIAAIKATLTWAVDAGRLTTNAALAVKVRVPKKAKLRDSDFTPAEARRILTAALILPSDKLAPEHALARRWIPWLCAYTGARVNEFSQLRAEDVTQIESIWTVRITPEAGTTKTNAARILPLHPHLIEQGFPAVAAAKIAGPLFYDPARQRVQGDSNRHFKKVGERLAEWVRKDVGISDPAVKPNHGWRHTFKTAARRAEIPESIADAILGHAPKSVGQSYGSVPLETLAAAIAKLPRFDATPVFWSASVGSSIPAP